MYHVIFKYVDSKGFCNDGNERIATYDEKFSVLKKAAKKFLRANHKCFAIIIESYKTGFKHYVV